MPRRLYVLLTPKLQLIKTLELIVIQKTHKKKLNQQYQTH